MRIAPAVYRLLLIFVAIVVAISFGYPQILTLPAGERVGRPAVATAQQAGRPSGPGVAIPQTSFSGEVVYWIHAGRAGRFFGLPGGTTTSISLVPIPDTNVNIRPQTPVRLEVKLCIELAVAGIKRPVGLLAFLEPGGIRLSPSVGGTGFLAGYVARPELGFVGNFAQLESWCFDWEGFALAGSRFIVFRWAVAPGGGTTLWGDFYAVSVWATKVK